MRSCYPWLLLYGLCLASTAGASEPPPSTHRQGLSGLGKELRIVPSPTVERAKLQRARAEELELALLKIDGVLDAHVQVMVPELSLAGSPIRPPKPRVAVLVKHGASEKKPLEIDDVRSLAMATVEGLERSGISVVFSLSAPHEAERLVKLGPLRVAADSRVPALGLLLGLSTLSMLLGALLVFRSLPRSRSPKG